MRLQELQNQALQLSICDRWCLVQSLLGSIQQETLLPKPPKPDAGGWVDLDPWTQSLIGAIQLGAEDPKDSGSILVSGS